MRKSKLDLLCPSFQNDLEGAVIYGVIEGSVENPRVSYLETGSNATLDSVKDLIGEIEPTELFRFAGKCVASQCAQFADGQCRLGKNIVKELVPVVDSVPRCSIRVGCRWFAENGVQSCIRCPQIITSVPAETPGMMRLLNV